MHQVKNAPRIHPTAIVEDNVKLGARTSVWDGVHIRGGAVIGQDCIIGEKTYIACQTAIGDFCKINAHVYICAGITIEDRVMIAAGVIFTNDRYPRAFADGHEGLAPSEPEEDMPLTYVRRGVTIGAGALIGPGIEIGEYAMVGMGAVVTQNVPPHALVFGSPARVHGYVCICGTPVPDENPRDCVKCGRSFEMIDGIPGLKQK